MWGGVKKRTHYGDVFKRWSASQGLETLRSSLYREPRPWYIAHTLHQANHLLQDHHCARLLAWSTSIVALRPSLTGKQEAYRYTQEMFSVFVRHHKVGQQSLNEYMRLCAVGRDLSSAFDWFKYWQEAQREAHDELSLLSWLLQVASLSPNDERVEDMALTVLELYKQRFAVPPETTTMDSNKASANPVAAPTAPSSSPSAPLQCVQFTPHVGEAQLRRFLCLLKKLTPRIEANAQLREFLATVPISATEAAAECAKVGWPTESSHRLFPQLEQCVRQCSGGDWPGCSGNAPEEEDPAVGRLLPRLRDSLLHPSIQAKLEENAAQHNVAEVVALVDQYEESIRYEREGAGGDRAAAGRGRSRGEELWRMYDDPTSIAFRRRLVERGGVTPELYHYLITAMATTQPSAALRTLKRMEDAQLRPLDVTRAVALVAAQDSPEERRRLFKGQLDEMFVRTRLDAEHDTLKIVEAYWKYDYVEFFHYRNALEKKEFYAFLLHQLGPQSLQQLLLDTRTSGPAVMPEDLILLDEDLLLASRHYFRAQVGRSAVQGALNEISTHMPKLDIGLVGTLPHFADYCLDANDSIANSEAALQNLIQPYDTIYVLDTSFVETSEAFLAVGSTSSSLVLIPYLCLSQLAESVANADRFVTFDAALQQLTRTEPFLASQRLRGLFAMVSSSSSSPQEKSGRRARVLHFTECICANQVDPQLLNTLGLSPSSSDNDQLLLILAMLSSLKALEARLVLCTDDAQLVKQLETFSSSSLFRSAVEVMSTTPPDNLDLDRDLVNDNPVLRGAEEWNSSKTFEPRLHVAVDANAVKENNKIFPEIQEQVVANTHAMGRDTATFSQGEAPASAESGTPLYVPTGAPITLSDNMNSPWLSLLVEEEEAMRAGTTAPLPSPQAAPITVSAPPPSSDVAPEDQELRANLMDLYETPLDVVPIGVRMEEASSLGSVFREFDSLEPEEREQRAADRAAARSSLSLEEKTSKKRGRENNHRRHRSLLEKEMLANRGASNKNRFQMARRLSNWSGGRVPFNLRYRVVEANIRDPRNAHLRNSYEAALAKKRASFKQRHG